MDFNNSKTKINLENAFIGESKARNKYTFFSKKAKDDGFIQIGKIFEETANNEKEHAEIWFKLLNDNKINSTRKNLKDAIEAEDFEYTSMYKEYAITATEEGFQDIARVFESVRQIEKTHRDRYIKLLYNLESDEIFKKDTEITWRCSKCGNQVVAKVAPKICPVCKHEQGYFEDKNTCL